MNLTSFEERVTLGYARYITSFHHDTANGSLLVGITKDTERFATDRLLRFNGVDEIQNEWIDRDDERMEGLIGVHEDKDSAWIRYTLVTEQREISFYAQKEADILDV